MSKIRFPEDMPKAPSVADADKMMIADASTNEAKHITFDQAKQYFTIEGQRIAPTAPGALPAGPSGQTRYMEVTAVGSWTYGGNTFTNADGYKTTLWWNGTAWSNAGSIKVKGDAGINGKTIENYSNTVAYSIGSQVFFNETEVYEALSSTVAGESPSTTPSKWSLVFQGGDKDFEQSTKYSLGDYYASLVRSVDVVTEGTVNLSLTTSNTTQVQTGNNQYCLYKLDLSTIDADTLDYNVYQANTGMANLILERADGTFVVVVAGRASGREFIKSTVSVVGFKYASFHIIKSLNEGGYFNFYKTDKNLKGKFSNYDDFLLGLLPNADEIKPLKDGSVGKLNNNNTTSSGNNDERLIYQASTSGYTGLAYNVYQAGSGLANIILERTDGSYTVVVSGASSGREYKKGYVSFEGYTKYSLYWTTAQNADAYFYLEKSTKKTLKKTLDEISDSTSLKADKQWSGNVYAKANVLSDWKTDLACHASSLYFDKRTSGDIYVVHHYNKTQIQEGYSTNQETGISIGNVCDLSEWEHIKFLARGDEFDGWKVPTSNTRVSLIDPFSFVDNTNNFRLYGSADNELDSFGSRLIFGTFNKTTKTFSNTITQCQFKYTHGGTTQTVLMSNAQIQNALNTINGVSDTYTGILTCPMIDYYTYNSEHYVVVGFGADLAGTVTNTHPGIICKTTDFITFEYVAQLPVGGNSIFGEASVAGQGANMYIIIRRTSGCDLYKYNISTQTWMQVGVSSGQSQSTSRPKILWYKSKLVIVYNQYANEYTTPNGVRQRRSNAMIAEVDPNTLSFKPIVSTQCPWGVHYFDVKQDMRGLYWMTYTGGRRYLSTGNFSNLEIVSFDELIESR